MLVELDVGCATVMFDLDWRQWRRLGRHLLLLGRLNGQVDFGWPEHTLLSIGFLSCLAKQLNENKMLVSVRNRMLSYQPLSSCCLTCCWTRADCWGVNSEPCKPCSTIRGPCWVCIT